MRKARISAWTGLDSICLRQVYNVLTKFSDYYRISFVMKFEQIYENFQYRDRPSV
jgi:hypothetical protein